MSDFPYQFDRPAPPTPPRRRADPSRPRRPVYRKKRFLIPFGLGLVLLGVLASSYVAVKRAEERARIVAAERARLEAYLEGLDAPYLRAPLLSGRQQQLLRRSRNATHLEHAQRLGVAPPATRDELSDLAGEAGLVEIDESPYYWVASLTHSVPYVTRDTGALLDTIGVRFQARLAEAGLPPYQYHISSVLRTQEDQAALRRVNVNAAVGTSSHEFGTTFDIHFLEYRYVGDAYAEVEATLGPLPYAYLYDEFARELAAHYDELATRYVSRLKAILGTVLIELEDEGYLVTVMEQRQPVYHTTVAQPLAGSDTATGAAATQR